MLCKNKGHGKWDGKIENLTFKQLDDTSGAKPWTHTDKMFIVAGCFTSVPTYSIFSRTLN